MDSEEEIEETSNFDIPKVSDESASQGAATITTLSPKAQSQLTAGSKNETRTVMSNLEQDRLTSSPSMQSEKEPQQSVDEKLSRSLEEFRRSKELSLNGKSSLDQLNKDSIQRPRTTKMYRQCQKHLREIIGKREMKNEELEKQQGDLKQRLNILECSMPAVMVWNIWRMSQSTCVPNLKRVMEKQFQGPASGEIYCPSTPSRHFDCRVREVEADRKQAQKRAEEARALWADKMAVLEDRNTRLEEARKLQLEIRERIEQLTIEAQKLREAAASKAEEDGSCEAGECGIIECKKKWLEKVRSETSIRSTDIECLEKLQELAENELYVKKQIAELERQEEAYMRTLQQADELWCKLESDAASTMSALQEQLEMKNAANQEMADRICQLEDVIEQLRARLATCRGELEKYLSVSKIEALIGRDDDFADVLHKEVLVGAELQDELVGRDGDMADVDDIGVLRKDDMKDKDMLALAELSDIDLMAKPDMADVDLEFTPDMSDAGLQRVPDVADIGLGVSPDKADLSMGVGRADLVSTSDAQMEIHPDDFAYEDERLKEARDYLAKYGIQSLSDLDKYGDDYVCPPDFSCNDAVFTETGLTEEEMAALRENRITAKELLERSGMPMDMDVEESVIKPSVEVSSVTKSTVTQERTLSGHETYAADEKVTVDKLTFEEDAYSAEELEVYEDASPIQQTERIEEVWTAEEAYDTEQDIRHVEEAAAYEDIRDVEEAEAYEDIRYAEEAVVYEDIKPVEELEIYEDASLIEQTGATEDMKSAKEPTIYEGITLSEEPTTYEGTRSVEEVRDYEDTRPAEEVAVYEDTRLAEEVAVYEDTRLAEEVAVYEDTGPAEKVTVYEDTGPAKKVTVYEDTRPAEEVTTYGHSRSYEELKVFKDISLTEGYVSVADAVHKAASTESKQKPEMPAKPISRYPEEATDEDNIRVPRNELLSWQDDIDTVRGVIAECPDCITVKKDADDLAAKMASYTETPVKEIIDRPRSRPKVIESPPVVQTEVQTKPEEIRPIAQAEIQTKPEEIRPIVQTEIQTKPEEIRSIAQTEIQARPQAVEAQITATPTMEHKDVDAEAMVQSLSPEEREPEITADTLLVSTPSERKHEEAEEAAAREKISRPDETRYEELPQETKPDAKAAPAETEPVSRKEEVVATAARPIPTEIRPAPTEEGPVPSAARPAPTEIRPAPMEEGLVPTAARPAATEVRPAPTEEKPAPTKEGLAPTEIRPTPTEEGLAPTTARPAPTEIRPAPTVMRPAPAEEGPVPTEEGLAPTTARPAPAEEGPVPTEEGLAPTTARPAPTEEGPVPTEIRPVPTAARPAPTEMRPAPAEEGPVPTEEGLAPTEARPAPTEIRPAPIEEGLTPTEEEPLPSEARPPLLDGELVTAEEKPELREEDVIPAEGKGEGDELEVLPGVVEVTVVPEEEEEIEGERMKEIQEVPEEVVEVILEGEIEEAEEGEEKEEEIEIPVDIQEEAPEEGKIDVDVEILPEIEIEPEEAEKEKPLEEELKVEEVPPLKKVKISVSEEDGICTCEQPARPLGKKVKVTQTEVTRIETIQVITQTVADVETQTAPTIIKQSQQPKLITVTKAVDPDPDTMQRLLSYAKPVKDQMTVMSITESSQTHSTSIHMTTTDETPPVPQHPVSSMYRSSKPEGAQMAKEQEIRSVFYGKRSAEIDQGKCNCCQCGRITSTGIPDSKFHTEYRQSSSTFKCAEVPGLKKSGGYGVDQAIQHNVLCPDCKLWRLQQTLKAQDPLKKSFKKPKRDQEVYTSKEPPPLRIKRKSDMGCMARIPKVKPDRVTRREIDRMKAEKDEDDESSGCVCSGLIQTGKPGVLKPVHCACGDPD